MIRQSHMITLRFQSSLKCAIIKECVTRLAGIRDSRRPDIRLNARTLLLCNQWCQTETKTNSNHLSSIINTWVCIIDKTQTTPIKVGPSHSKGSHVCAGKLKTSQLQRCVHWWHHGSDKTLEADVNQTLKFVKLTSSLSEGAVIIGNSWWALIGRKAVNTGTILSCC